MMAENCAESAITDIPQTIATATTAFGQGNSAATSRQQAPLVTIAMIVTLERERTKRARSARSAAMPAHTQPANPTAMTAKAVKRTEASRASVADEAARITATHVHSE